MNVTVIVIEALVESDRLFAEAADCFGDRAYVGAVRVLAGVGTRTEFCTWLWKNSGCHCFLVWGLVFEEVGGNKIVVFCGSVTRVISDDRRVSRL